MGWGAAAPPRKQPGSPSSAMPSSIGSYPPMWPSCGPRATPLRGSSRASCRTLPSSSPIPSVIQKEKQIPSAVIRLLQYYTSVILLCSCIGVYYGVIVVPSHTVRSERSDWPNRGTRDPKCPADSLPFGYVPRRTPHPRPLRPYSGDVGTDLRERLDLVVDYIALGDVVSTWARQSWSCEV